jgi:UDP-glucose 4-epimerase
VVVTGGAGFIGTSVVRRLLAQGDRVRVIDSGVAAGFGSLEGLDVELDTTDLAGSDDLSPLLAGCHAVVHLAARTSVPESITDPVADFRANVVGTFQVLEAARRAAVPRFVFASSLSAAGSAAPPVREDSLPLPIVPYGAAKLAAEGYLRAYAEAYGMETVALRFANAYGPDSLHKASVVHAFIRRLIAAEPIEIHGDGRQTRDFVHVDDIARAVLAALDAPAERVAGRVLPIGSSVETAIVDLAETLFAAVGRRVPVHHRPLRPGNVARSAVDLGAARSALGIGPAVPLADGLRGTYDWFEAALS